jgi:outer membrane beta-barrel protein
MDRKLFLGIALFVAVVCCWVSNGWCEEQRTEEEVFAVQNRVFHKSHEIDLSIGYIADDEFFMVYPISVGYTYHLNEMFSWEVGRLQYFFNKDRGLKGTLEDPPFNAQAEFFNEPKYMVNSHLVFRPLYGKSAFMNKRVVNHETYLFAGPGITGYEREYSNGDSDTEDVLNLSFGAGFKYFLNQRWCLNVEVRDIISFRSDDNENNVYFGIGVGYRFDMAPRKVEEDPTMKKLAKILSE